MANRFEPPIDYMEDYEEWCKTRPPKVAELARKFPPWMMLRWSPRDMPYKGLRCFSVGVHETEDGDAKMMIAITGQYNFIEFERRVFGVDASELVECELPGPDEKLGAVLTQEQAREKYGFSDFSEDEDGDEDGEE